MPTERRDAILGFKVEGERALEGALSTVGTLQGRLAALARDAKTVAGGGLDAQSSATLFRNLFTGNEAAIRNFDRTLQATRNNSRTAFSDMQREAETLTLAIRQLEALSSRGKFTATDFGPAAGQSTFTHPELPGYISRVPGGFSPVTATGQVSPAVYPNRPQAAEALRNDTGIRLEHDIEQLTAAVAGRKAGFDLLAAQQGGGKPPTPPAAPPTPAAAEPPDPARNAAEKALTNDTERLDGEIQSLIKTVEIAKGVFADLKAYSILGTHAEGEVLPQSQRAVDAAQIQAERRDIANQAIIDADRLRQEALARAGAGARPSQILSAAQQVQEEHFPGLIENNPDPVYINKLREQFGQLITSATALTRSTESLSAAQVRAERYERSIDPNASPLQRAGAQFEQGFFGRTGSPFAEQIGQVAKFSILYGAAYQALFAFQQGLQAAVQQTIDYQQATIELSIATGRSTEELSGFAGDLGRAATQYGLSPGEGVRTGAAAVGIFGLQDAPFDLATAQTTAFTEAVGQVAFVTGRTAEQVTQDLGAISQAFDLNASQSRLAQDLDAFFSKRFGSPAGGTLETVAQIGSLGREAGFNQQEVTALASLIQSRTGQTPAATAGFLSQFFGRAGDPALQQTFAGLGIDISAPFRDQIQELSKIMRRGDLGESLRLQIINAFGRGRSGQTAAIIAEQFPEINRGAKDAQTEAAGAGEQQFQERLDTVGGYLTELGGALNELAVNVGESGLLDIFGALVVVTKELVEATNTIFGLFNTLPRGVRDAIVALGIFTLALRSSAVKNFAGAAIDDFRLATGASTAGGVRGTASGLLSAAGGGTTLAIGGAVAGLLAVAALREQSLNLDKAMGAAGLSLTAIGAAETPDALRSAASSVRSEAASVREAPGLLIDAVTLGAASRSAEALADHLEDSADLAEHLANAEERRLEFEARRASVGVFQNPASVDDISTGLQQLEASGAGTVQQVNLLSRAINSLGRDSDTAASRLRQFPAEFTQAVLQAFDSENLVEGLEKGLPRVRDLIPFGAGGIANELGSNQYNSVAAGDYALSQILTNGADSGEFLASLTDPDQGGVDLEGMQKRVAAYVQRKGEITGSSVNKLIDREMSNFNVTEVDGKELSENGQARLRELVRNFLERRLRDFANVNDPNRVYSGPDLKKLIDENLNPKFDAAAASLSAQGQGEGSQAQIQLARQRLSVLRNIRVSRADRRPDSYYSEQLRAAEVAFAQQQLARSQALREAQQDAAKGDAEVRRIGRRFFRRDVQRALDSGSIDLLKQVIANGNQHQIDILRAQIKETIEVVKAKLDGDAQMVSVIDRTAGLVDGTVDLVNKSQNLVEKRLANLREKLHMLGQVGRSTVTTNQYNRPDALEDTSEPTDTAAQIAAAQQSAEAARNDDAVAQARAALAAASADLAAAKPGTVEYYNALQSYYEAQRELTDTIVETSNAARSASVAGTDDAVAQARVSLQNAAATLNTETPGTLAYYQALADYREAQLALDDAIVETQNARILARASARGSPVITATAELEAARNSLRNETEGTLAYYQALSQFNEAKRALSEAIREQKYVQDQLAGDVTDPVDQARADLRRANRQLRYDQRINAGRDQIQADKLDVRQQEAALEDTKFQQWLGDLQTNEQLERITNSQYISTLERRIRHLRDIRHRTRQEQDELNQLLQVLNEAQNALSGQFNIGNIDIPTPYEARRYVEERRKQIDANLQAGGGGAPSFYHTGAESNQASSTTTNTTTIQIDGADVATVRRVLTDILGRGAIRTFSTATSKR